MLNLENNSYGLFSKYIILKQQLLKLSKWRSRILKSNFSLVV